jgi:hypothetical protein
MRMRTREWWLVKTAEAIAEAMLERGGVSVDADDVYVWMEGPDTDEEEVQSLRVDAAVTELLGADRMAALEHVARVVPGVCYYLGVPGTLAVDGGVDLHRILFD